VQERKVNSESVKRIVLGVVRGNYSGGNNCVLLRERGGVMSYQEHVDPEVQSAIVRLDCALRKWERRVSRQSIVIIREQEGFVHRSISGHSGVSESISDEQLISVLD